MSWGAWNKAGHVSRWHTLLVQKVKKSSNPVKVRLENQNIHLPLAYHRAPLPLSLVTVHRNAEKRRCTAGGK